MLVYGHQGNLIGGVDPQGQPKLTCITSTQSKIDPSTTLVLNNQRPQPSDQSDMATGLHASSSSDMELESMIVLFFEKRKELNQSLLKVEALSRQLEELKSGINGSTATYNRFTNNPVNRVIGDKFDDLEKLRQELTNQTRLNDQQNVTLMHKQNLLMQRKCEIAGINERISELQKRLAMKRMLNQQLSSQAKSRTGVAYGLPNDNSLNSCNPRLRSSVGPCNNIRLTNNYNRNNVINVAAVEPFQRSTVTTNNYPANSYDKSDENIDPILGDISPTKQQLTQFQNLPYRNKYSPVEITSSNAYPPTVNINNVENTTNINNKTNCILNTHHHHHQQQQPQQQQQPFHHLPLSHHQQQQQMQLQRQQQQQQHHHHHQQQQPQQQYVSVGNTHKSNGNNVNLSLANEMISQSESSERSCDENGTCELVRPQSDGLVGGGENTLINSPLKHKIHLRERPSPSGSSSSSSDQLPAGYSPSKKVLENISDNMNNNHNHNNKSLGVNSVNHSSNNDYYGSRGVGGNSSSSGADGDNNNENMMTMGNCDNFNNTNNYRFSEQMSGYDETASSEQQQLIDCIRKNSRLVDHHHHHHHSQHQKSQQLQQKQQSELIEKCVSDLPNNINNNNNNNSNNNNGNNNQNCSSLDEDDRSTLSDPSVTSSSGSSSSNQQNVHNLNHHHNHNHNVNPTKTSFERKPLNFQWPPPQYQSIDHQQSKSITSKPDEGKKVTWAKKRILSKTTDDLRSPTKDSFYLKESPSSRPTSIHLMNNNNNNNRQQQNNNSKQETNCQHEDHHNQYNNQQNHKLSLDTKKIIINTFVNSNQNNNNCNKIKSSLKKDNANNHRVHQKKDHEGLTRRVSFDPLALLLDAALEGELDLVKKTSKIQDVSAANDEGITALHNTICAGHFEIVKYLVEIGCDVNAPDSDGWTPLHCAASCNNLTMVKYLVEHGACIFATTFPDKETAAQKCEEGEEGFDRCSQYLLHIQDSLGIMNDGIVYAVYDYDSQSSDELSFKDSDCITILRRGDEDEKDWWWARLSDKEGYVPRNLLGLYPRVKADKQDKVDAMD
ncbi:putative uncharacterized protein DDB_G0286901 [Panonychus citri]|uniref:putative uncharacterized protein DDB_G0286901 n=1 Tax=Panonychus citri TaxID=50023 RepID=UPI002307250C|nr:putative uncharacterized protein DDB_G0286901 [Panonychus citri]